MKQGIVCEGVDFEYFSHKFIPKDELTQHRMQQFYTEKFRKISGIKSRITLLTLLFTAFLNLSFSWVLPTDPSNSFFDREDVKAATASVKEELGKGDGIERYLTKYDDIPSGSVITFDDQGFSGCQIISDNHSFSAIGKTFNIYAANFDGSTSTNGSLWFETGSGGCWHPYTTEFEDGGYITAGYTSDSGQQWYAPEALVVKTTDGSDFKFTSFKAHDAEWNSWGNYLKISGYKNGVLQGSESVVIVSDVEPYHSTVTLTNPVFESIDEVRITMDKDNNPAFGDSGIPHSNAEGLFHSFDTFVIDNAVSSATEPTVTTSAASSITATGATLNGNVTSDGGASVTARGFVYSPTNSTPTLGGSGVIQEEDGSGTGIFDFAISGLSASTTYYYQAYATNSAGTSYGGVESFTTSATAGGSGCSFDSNDGGAITDANFSSTSDTFIFSSPFSQSFTACETGALSSIKILSTANSSGITVTVYSGEGNSGTNLGTVSGLSVTAALSINDRSTLDMSSAGISLTSGQKYTFVVTTGSISTRVTRNSIYADGDAFEGTIKYQDNDFLFGIEISEAPSTDPTVTTSAASSITATGATFGGNVTDDGGASVSERGFVYSSTNNSPTIGGSGVIQEADGSGTGVFDFAISGLSASTTYYYQAYATNSAGTSYGGVESFTTESAGVLLSSSPILTFTMSAVDLTGDDIASDGEGGSVQISDINIDVFNISDTNGSLHSDLDWRNNTFLTSNDGSFSGLTDPNTGSKGMSIKSPESSEFKLIQFEYYNWGETSTFTNTIVGYRDGVEVATTTFDGYDSGYLPQTVTLNSAFSNVDEVRFYISSGGYEGEQNYTNHTINNIQVSSPVVTIPPTVNVNNGLSLNQGTIQFIGSGNLSIGYDETFVASDITFTITSAVSYGVLFIDSNQNFLVDAGEVELVENATFTAEDIDGERLSYKNTIANQSVDSFIFKVTDPNGGELTNQTFNITVNQQPSVSTVAASGVSAFTANFEGNITSDGGVSVTARGFVFSSTNSTPILGGSGVIQETVGSGTGIFDLGISDLSPATTYYYQAYATNGVGTSYGGVQNFTTSSPPCTGTITIGSTASGASYSINGSVLTTAGEATVPASVIEDYLQNNGNLVIQSCDGNIIVATAISPALSAERTLTFKASGSIVFNSGTSLIASGDKLNTILWSDADGNQSGSIFLNESTIQTNGGHLWMAGGEESTTPWNGLTVGDGSSYADATHNVNGSIFKNGMTIYKSSVNTDDGNLFISGIADGASGGPAGYNGVYLEQSTLSSGAGAIDLNAISTGTINDGSWYYGLLMGTIVDNTSAIIESTSGLITINGETDFSENTHGAGVGLYSFGNPNSEVIIRTVSGAIDITGSLNSTDFDGQYGGIFLFGSGEEQIVSQTGTISLEGISANPNVAGINQATGNNTSAIGFDGTNVFTGDITFNSNTFINYAGVITANNLELLGSGVVYDFSNAGNNVNSLTANTGSVTYLDGDELTVNNLTATGEIEIATESGNLTLSGNVKTSSSSSDAIILNAGKSEAIGTETGGDIIVSGSPAVSTGPGGIAKLFSGSELTSTGLTAWVGGSSYVRKEVDETTTIFDPALSAGSVYALYRYQDIIQLTIDSQSLTLSKSYDGTTTATVTDVVLAGVRSGDDVSVTAEATYDNASVGTGKTITVVYTLSGADAANYSVPENIVVTNGEITAKALTITGLTGNNKTYDGTTNATVSGTATLNGLEPEDEVTLGGTGVFTFATADVGIGIAITASGYELSGSDAGNYNLILPSGLSATISPKSLTVTGLTAEDKTYDGTNSATVSGTPQLQGIIDGDVVEISGTPIFIFIQSGVGTDITVVDDGCSTYFPTGTDAANYSITQPEFQADILPKELTITANDDSKTYGETYTFAGTEFTVDGLTNEDAVT
ncbi:YDG domain-containing protein, partial [Algoriphagus sp.]|uniref:beta strand repeat-containing protein n=1 Tax=Algoriphagus sp. TaxID=1872435 RepID=UPI00262ADEA3